MTRRATRTALALAGFLVVALVACGVPLDDGPQAITRTTIAATPTEMTTTPGPGSTDIEVYFLNEQSLQALLYPVAGDPTLTQALSFVLDGVRADAPTDPLLHSAVPPRTQLRSAVVADGVATIDLSSDMDDIGGDLQKQAFAQLVFTAMAFDRDQITAVSFRVDGKPRDAPTDDNNLTRITTDNYRPPLNPK